MPRMPPPGRRSRPGASGHRRHVPAWVGQVQMLVELGELHEADLWADKALELFRDNGELPSAKAVARARLGRAADALQCSDAGLRAPENAEPVYGGRVGRHPDALRELLGSLQLVYNIDPTAKW